MALSAITGRQLVFRLIRPTANECQGMCRPRPSIACSTSRR